MKKKWNRHKFSDDEQHYPVLVRPSQGSMLREVPMGRVKYMFDVDDDDTEYDDKTVVITGPDKRGIMDIKAENVFPQMFVEYTLDMCDERDDPDNSWTLEEIVECLDEGEYDYLFFDTRATDSNRPSPPGILSTLQTREEELQRTLNWIAYKKTLNKPVEVSCSSASEELNNAEPVAVVV